jgi:hypothetical protein
MIFSELFCLSSEQEMKRQASTTNAMMGFFRKVVMEIETIVDVSNGKR